MKAGVRVIEIALKKKGKLSRSKQNVRDKVEPLKDSAGNIKSQVFLMAEDLNGYFSSVFTREDISSLPVSDTKFQEAKSENLGQLIVTPEMVAKKIKATKENREWIELLKTTNGNSRTN